MTLLYGIAFVVLMIYLFPRFTLGAVAFVVLVGIYGGSITNTSAAYNPTHDELAAYPVSCEAKTEQLAQLKELQARKNFNSDPDSLNTSDRAYNGQIKATIWWYSYNCPQN